MPVTERFDEISGPDERRCGFVALIGAPNVGKSTLVNRLVGAKVSIVTHKAQTTRTCIRGIALEGASQIVLVDTPGIFAPRRRLEQAMVEAAWAGLRDADAAVWLVDAAKPDPEEAGAVCAELADWPRPRCLVLNKIDRVDKDKLLPLAERLNARLSFDRTFMVSALTGAGVDDLRRHLATLVPAGPWLYPEDQITEAPLRALAAEVTREKLIMRLHDELPYRSTVETTGWEERKDGSARVEQTIYVERDSQKGILLGAKGQTIKAISSAARAELAEILERPVHLFIFVKVRKNWFDDPERYRQMGLEFPPARR